MPMNNTWEFDGLLFLDHGKGHWVDFPFDSKKEFGSLKPVRIFVWFDGYKYRTSLAPKGDGTHWIHIRKEIRDAIGKGDGDLIHVRIELDLESRDPDMPEELIWLLENEPETKATFDSLSPSTRKYLIESVVNAKTEETRVNNINKVFEYLSKKKRE
jgi:hypothetical protein